MSSIDTPRPMGNPRAEAHFVASGLPDTLRPVVAQDAHYMMNCTGTRYSDAVASCCDALVNGHQPASTVAQAMLARITG